MPGPSRRSWEEAGKELVPILDGNLVDTVWGSARPQAPATRLRTHKLEFAGGERGRQASGHAQQAEGVSKACP